MANTDSEIQTATLESKGVWVNIFDDPFTLKQYLYTGGDTSQKRSVSSELLHFAGREFPVAEFGDAGNESVTVNMFAPTGPNYVTDIEFINNLVQVRETIVVRDARGRKIIGIASSAEMSDSQSGTNISLTVERTDQEEGV